MTTKSSENQLHTSAGEMTSLKHQLIQRLHPIVNGKDVVLFDRPTHFNVGDLLIDKGTRDLIHECGGRLIGNNSVIDYQYPRNTTVKSESTVILIQGGGNFGDLYPRHTRLWVETLKRFRRNPVVMLPQSIHYQDESNFQELALAMEEHPALIVFVRDRFSHDFLRRKAGNVKVDLLPDMAVSLYGHLPHCTGSGTLMFRRRDMESAENGSGMAFDWRDLVSRNDKRLSRFVNRAIQLQGCFGINFGAYSLLNLFHERLIAKAVKKFGLFSHIDSDRLHAIILGQLLNMQLTPRDNTYQKIKRYLETWAASGSGSKT